MLLTEAQIVTALWLFHNGVLLLLIVVIDSPHAFCRKEKKFRQNRKPFCVCDPVHKVFQENLVSMFLTSSIWPSQIEFHQASHFWNQCFQFRIEDIRNIPTVLVKEGYNFYKWLLGASSACLTPSYKTFRILFTCSHWFTHFTHSFLLIDILTKHLS